MLRPGVLGREGASHKDDNIRVLVRSYLLYDGSGYVRQVFLEDDKIEVEGVNTLSEIKEKLSQSDQKSLQLRHFTIVSKEMHKILAMNTEHNKSD